jgi:hypothetical protein
MHIFVLIVAIHRIPAHPSWASNAALRNSGTSGRSQSRPLGREEFQSVANGNILCARTLVILWICAALQIWWILEQPQGSFMEHHPCFQQVLALLDVHRHRMTMGSYGGSSEKPTWLYSCDWLRLQHMLFHGGSRDIATWLPLYPFTGNLFAGIGSKVQESPRVQWNTAIFSCCLGYVTNALHVKIINDHYFCRMKTPTKVTFQICVASIKPRQTRNFRAARIPTTDHKSDHCGPGGSLFGWIWAYAHQREQVSQG